MPITVIKNIKNPNTKTLGMVGPGGLFKIPKGDSLYIKGRVSSTNEAFVGCGDCFKANCRGNQSVCTSIPGGTTYIFDNTREVIEYAADLSLTSIIP
jgi:hypothetical protein